MSADEAPIVVTISRQYGSGGREVGEKLAKKLGVAYYDKELIARAAQESGLDQELIEEIGEKPANPISYLFSFAAGTSVISEETLPLSDRVFIAQSRVLKQIAQEGGVVVGRCADKVLEDNPNVVKVLIQADWDAKVARVMQRNDIDQDAAEERIRKTDRRRASYYQHYAGRPWGDSANYDMTISTTPIGIDNTVELLKRYTELFYACKGGACE